MTGGYHGMDAELVDIPGHHCRFCKGPIRGTEGWEWVRCEKQCEKTKLKWFRLEEAEEGEQA